MLMYVLIIVYYLWSENTPAWHSRASTAVISRAISRPCILLRARYNSWPYSCKNGNVPLHSIFSVNDNYVYLALYDYHTYLYRTSAARCKEGGATGYPSFTRKVAGYNCVLLPALLLWVNWSANKDCFKRISGRWHPPESDQDEDS